MVLLSSYVVKFSYFGFEVECRGGHEAALFIFKDSFFYNEVTFLCVAQKGNTLHLQ